MKGKVCNPQHVNNSLKCRPKKLQLEVSPLNTMNKKGKLINFFNNLKDLMLYH